MQVVRNDRGKEDVGSLSSSQCCRSLLALAVGIIMGYGLRFASWIELSARSPSTRVQPGYLDLGDPHPHGVFVIDGKREEGMLGRSVALLENFSEGGGVEVAFSVQRAKNWDPKALAWGDIMDRRRALVGFARLRGGNLVNRSVDLPNYVSDAFLHPVSLESGNGTDLLVGAPSIRVWDLWAQRYEYGDGALILSRDHLHSTDSDSEWEEPGPWVSIFRYYLSSRSHRSYGMGSALTDAGDLNNDGIPDIAIGAPRAKRRGFRKSPAVGRCYVLLGQGGCKSEECWDRFEIVGRRPDESTCAAVSGGADLNGRNGTDLLIGAPDGSNGIKFKDGVAFVVYGGASAFQSGGGLKLSDLKPSEGIWFEGTGRYSQLGASVAIVGDVNEDGHDDFLIGAPRACEIRPWHQPIHCPGKVFVVFGGPTLNRHRNMLLDALNGTEGFVIVGEHHESLFGQVVAKAGDFNGDGIADFAISAPGAPGSESKSDTGRVYVVHGGRGLGATGCVNVSSIPGRQGLVITGRSAGERCCDALAGGKDFDGDGLSDLVLGSPRAHQTTLPDLALHAGKAYIVLGRSSHSEVI